MHQVYSWSHGVNFVAEEDYERTRQKFDGDGNCVFVFISQSNLQRSGPIVKMASRF